MFTAVGLIDLCLHVCLELTRSNLALFPLVNALTTLLQSNPEVSQPQGCGCDLNVVSIQCVQGYHVLGLGWLLLHHLPSPHTSARLLTLCKMAYPPSPPPSLPLPLL